MHLRNRPNFTLVRYFFAGDFYKNGKFEFDLSEATMVVKTLKCAFSEKEIYPGHGSLQIRKDGRQLFFIDSKSKSLHNQGKKAAKIVWTRNWRVKHKKIKVTRDVRRIKKKTKK